MKSLCATDRKGALSPIIKTEREKIYMKIRSDFVTNSSSGSFIIAYKKPSKIDNETLEKYPFLKNYPNLIEKILFAENDNDTTTGIKIFSISDYNKWFVDRYGRNNTIGEVIEADEGLSELYYECKKYLEDGFCLLDKDVDYNDSYCSNMLYELAKDKENFIILRDE